MRGTTVLTSSMLFVWVGVSGALVVGWFATIGASISASSRVKGMSKLASWSLRCRCASRCFLRFSRCCLRISGGTYRLSFCTVYGHHSCILRRSHVRWAFTLDCVTSWSSLMSFSIHSSVKLWPAASPYHLLSACWYMSFLQKLKH